MKIEIERKITEDLIILTPENDNDIKELCKLYFPYNEVNIRFNCDNQSIYISCKN